MIIGIVGSEGAKFTHDGEIRAKMLIRHLLTLHGVTGYSSGHCHLGGIDIWTEIIGEDLKLKPFIFPPKTQSWLHGYKPRNELIAHTSDEVHCITVDRLPPDFKGMKFTLCYHCGTSDHVKSGGCWTTKYARTLGKPTFLHIIENTL